MQWSYVFLALTHRFDICKFDYVEGLVQNCVISIAYAPEIPQPSTKTSKYCHFLLTLSSQYTTLAISAPSHQDPGELSQHTQSAQLPELFPGFPA